MPRKPSTHSLSARELEVLRLIAAGLSSPVIAHQLRITERTVKSHKTYIFAKLGASNSPHAVAIAYQHGWLGLDGDEAEVRALVTRLGTLITQQDGNE